MSLAGRIVALVGIAVGIAGLAIDLWVILDGEAGSGRSLAATLIYFWTFFTHVGNAGVLLVYLATLTRWGWLGWFRQPVTQASWAGNIALVMVFFHFMLAPYFHFEGPILVANDLLHYVAPLIYLLWWAVFTRHGSLRYGDVPLMLVPGLVYLAWALGRGAVVGEYPYDILDVNAHGYGGVAVGAGIVILAVAAFCLVLVTVDRVMGRGISVGRRPAAPR